MSESSDDDWFNKDIDELVQAVEKKLEANRQETEVRTSPTSSAGTSSQNAGASTHNDFKYGEDYGGNYNIPEKADNTKSKPKRNTGKQTKENEVYVQPLPIKTLSALAELSPVDVFLEIAQKDCGFLETFYANLSNRKCSLMIKILSKICSLPLYEFKMELLPAFVESEEFHLQILDCVKDDLLARIEFSDVPEILVELVIICKDVYRLNLVNINFKVFVKSIYNVLNDVKTKCPVEFLDPVKSELLKIYDNKLYKQTGISGNDIYPTLDELMQPEGSIDLKPNIVEGKFDSVEHYLDVHKSLLREDFISPLREFIGKLKGIPNSDITSLEGVYKKVRFVMNRNINLNTSNHQMLLLDIYPDRNTFVGGVLKTQYQQTFKNFMTGTMLCLTTSLNFDDLILVNVNTAVSSSNNLISDGYVEIEILRMYNIMHIFDKEFIMFESKVFFAPYHHVFKALNRLDESNFPLANYIVNCDKSYHPPDYLRDLQNPHYKLGKKKFNPLDPPNPIKNGCNKWCDLNSSQIEAFLHALRNKFSLIQGPPGTGKTYVGLKILNTLIKNVDAPILIICYTNHALDQFLHGILKTTTDIVRMGNQSKNQELDKYNVKQMYTDTNDRKLGTLFYNVKTEYAQQLEKFEEIQRDHNGTDVSYDNLLDVEGELHKLSRKLEELKQISTFNLIKNKRVVGMTTTYAARSSLLLELLKMPIIIFEEAAEVLESHIVATLRKSTQHVILIGDHKQLRPTTSVYKMSQKYKMDISLFERMINNNLNSVCLKHQFRMRKEIADLLRPTIYKELFDDKQVTSYKNVKGMKNNLFFITHVHEETRSTDESSKCNIHEAKYLAALANYLILQGYSSHDLVILTPYNGQSGLIYKTTRAYPLLRRVRVRSVDSFQGEESKIILLSLVRNNKEASIGFLAMTNRICVSLSRAQEGLYIMGNIDLLSQCNSTWKNIRQILELNKSIGDHLPLYCEHHKQTTKVKELDDFKKVRFGGCNQECIFHDVNGHICAGMCHSLDWEYTI